MTLTADPIIIRLAGTGSTTEVPITFVFYADTDLKVTLINDATEVETPWTQDTQYTLVGGSGSIGTLTVETSPTDYTPQVGETLVVKSDRANTQDTSLTTGGIFPSVSVEQRFDIITRLIQQVTEEIDRAIKFSEGSSFTDIVFPQPGAAEFIRWNMAGLALETAPAVFDNGTFLQSGSGAVARTFDSKVAEMVSVKDFGAVGDGVADDTAAIQAALDFGKFLAFPEGNRIVFVPTGQYRLNSGLTVGQHQTIVGEMAVAGGSEFWFFGGTNEDCIKSDGIDTLEKSRVSITNLRIYDKRTSPASGSGILLENVDNRTEIDGCHILLFPTAQIYLTAPSGKALDNVEIRNTWLGPDGAGVFGILIERASNNITIDQIYCDNINGSIGIKLDIIDNDLAVTSISNCKFEANHVDSKSIVLGQGHGHLNISNIIQQNSSGIGATIIEFLDGVAGRATLRNIFGSNHSVIGVAPHTIEIVSNQARIIDGRIDWMTLTSAGYPVRFRSHNATPEGVVDGFPGELCHRTDGLIGRSAYLKTTGVGTNTGWLPVIVGKFFSAALTPSIVAANTTAEQTFTVTGIVDNYGITVAKPTHQTGLGIVNVRASADNQIKITYMNVSGSGITPSSETYIITQSIILST